MNLNPIYPDILEWMSLSARFVENSFPTHLI